jgi:type IV pilus assembly protein PilC
MSIFERVPIQEKINFARHLALIVQSGVPILEGLRILRKQTESKTLAKIMDQTIADVNNGKFLADSLEKHKNVFGDFFVSIIRVGEASGTLAINLIYLASEMEKAKDLQGKVRSALIYPAVILVATLGIVSVLIFVVFPKVLPIFASLKVPLPITTRILIAVTNFLFAYGWITAGGVIAFIIIFRILVAKITALQMLLDRMVFFLPVVSNLTISVSMANMTRVLGILLKGGVKIVEAVTVTSTTLGNLVYKKELENAAEELRRGSQIGSYMAAHTRIFPPLMSSLVGIAENTGNLEENLVYLSDYYTKQADETVGNLTTILEPFLLLFMGLLVGFIALSIITPIYQITANIH